MSRRVFYSIKLRTILSMAICMLISLSTYIWLATSIFHKDKNDFVQEAALTRSSTLAFQTQMLIEHTKNMLEIFHFLKDGPKEKIQAFLDSDRFILLLAHIKQQKKKIPSTKYINEFEEINDFEYLDLFHHRRLREDPLFNYQRIKDIPPRLLIDLNSMQNASFTITPSTHLSDAPTWVGILAINKNEYLVLMLDFDSLNALFANDALFKNSLWNAEGTNFIKQNKFNDLSYLAKLFASHEITGVDFYKTSDGEKKLIGFSKLKNFKLMTITEMDAKRAYHADKILIKKGMMFGLIILALAISGGLYASASAGNRSVELAGDIDLLSTGGTLLKRELKYSDEVEKARHSLNNLTENFQKIVQAKLETSIEKITTDEEKIFSRNIETMLYPLSSASYSQAELFSYSKAGVPFQGTFWYHAQTKSGILILIMDLGKSGAEAAFIGNFIKGAIASISNMDIVPTLVLNFINDQLIKSTFSGLKIKAFCGLLKPESGFFYFANAGHTPPLLFNKDTPTQLSALGDNQGTLIGTESNPTFQERKLALKVKDVILFYNDNITKINAIDSKLPIGQKAFLTQVVSTNKKFSLGVDQMQAFESGLSKIAGRGPWPYDVVLVQLTYLG